MNLGRRVAAEALGTAFLLMAVVGSGIMAERLAGGSQGLALLANTIATGTALAALIATFAPISGAHFNPVVTLASVFARELSWRDALAYIGAQFACAVIGVWLAHAMFGMPILEISTHQRNGLGQWVGEIVATFGLVAVIESGKRHFPASLAAAVGAYIAAGYWFTSSTSFANPAVALARSLTESFTGIAPGDVPGFVVAELAGGGAGFLVMRRLLGRQHQPLQNRPRGPI